MSEYIERETVEKAVLRYSNGDVNKQELFMLTDLLGDITDIPTADVQPVNQWISVKDKLPEVGKLVIVCDKQGGVGAMELLSNGKWYSNGMAWSAEWVVYWQPLPEPPMDGDTNG